VRFVSRKLQCEIILRRQTFELLTIFSESIKQAKNEMPNKYDTKQERARTVSEENAAEEKAFEVRKATTDKAFAAHENADKVVHEAESEYATEERAAIADAESKAIAAENTAEDALHKVHRDVVDKKCAAKVDADEKMHSKRQALSDKSRSEKPAVEAKTCQTAHADGEKVPWR